MARFGGRTVVITGGATGIGLATARLFASEGARVVISGRSEARGEEVAADLRRDGGEVTFLRTDVALDRDVARLAAHAVAIGGSIDLWFSNAGVEGPVGEIADWTDSAITEVLLTNVKGVLSGFFHASPHMGRGSLFVLNGSFVGPVAALPNSIPYATSKSAVVTAGRAAAGALEPLGIRVVTVCPYVFATPMVDRIASEVGLAASELAAGVTPSHLLGRPEEVAAVVADLFDGRLGAESGAALLVDAGPTVSELPPPSL